MSTAFDTDRVVSDRYGAAAKERELALCCPVDYNAKYLEVIPQEVIDRDYGCGDPSKYVKEGETVLDLGSGGGKICFIAAQVVGPRGQVIGVDINASMLDLARRSQATVAEKLGFDNVQFRCGRIQDLALDRETVDKHLRANPVQDEASLREFESLQNRLRTESPLIPDNSIDVVVSNCVLNLVDPQDKRQLFSEIYRVLRPGGRAVISDIIADEPVPKHMQSDAGLWSGCISGAFQEREFLDQFEETGFYGVQFASWEQKPWKTVEGIEFRSATVIAYKGKEGPCFEHNEAVMYRGPFQNVSDDDGHQYERGERIAVCRKTFQILTSGPYAEHFLAIEPRESISPEQAKPFDCNSQHKRSPSVTKGKYYNITDQHAASCCGSDGC